MIKESMSNQDSYSSALVSEFSPCVSGKMSCRWMMKAKGLFNFFFFFISFLLFFSLKVNYKYILRKTFLDLKSNY